MTSCAKISSCSKTMFFGVPITDPTLTACKPGYVSWICWSLAISNAGGPQSQEPAWTACSRVGNWAERTLVGSAIALICSSDKPHTNPRGANIFMFSSKNGRASRMAFASVSAMCQVSPRARSVPSTVSRPTCPRASRHAVITRSAAPSAAAPPPIIPLIPCLAIKFHSLLTGTDNGLPALYGQILRPRY